jgi:hypothetical protein
MGVFMIPGSDFKPGRIISVDDPMDIGFVAGGWTKKMAIVPPHDKPTVTVVTVPKPPEPPKTPIKIHPVGRKFKDA